MTDLRRNKISISIRSAEGMNMCEFLPSPLSNSLTGQLRDLPVL